ncbi:MAG: alpha/beta hydrolase, partial [Rhizobiaceae bacterium]|nr:alpha/beta hydrolase [Rhizobiaceae bacterium]
RLIFWNAFVLNDGESLMDAVPQHYRDLFEGLAAASGDDTVTLPFPIWREAFINDASLELAQETYDRLSPEPLQPLRDKLDLKKFYELIQSGKIACSYINCTEDIALPQGPDTGWHPRMSNRLGLFRLVQMPGSHEVCFSDPIGLGDALIAAGRD